MVVFVLTDNTNLKENVQNQTTNNQNPNPIPNTETMKEEHDRNSEILAHLGALRRLSSILRGEDHIRQPLGEALDNITNAIYNAQGALYKIISYKHSQRK